MTSALPTIPSSSPQKSPERKDRKGYLGWRGRIEYVTQPVLIGLVAPVIYGLAVPILFLDLAVALYQFVCFPVFRIEKVRRADYVRITRHRLRYLPLYAKVNCLYCSYANGVIAFAREVAARTEQLWCPIKHAKPPRDSHPYFQEFVEYGDEDAYRKRRSELRRKIGISEG
jgi:hypothetical protein